MTVAAASSRSRYRTRLTDRARWRFSSRLRLRHRRRAANLTFGGGSVDEPWQVGAGEEASWGNKAIAFSAIASWVCVMYFGRMLPFLGNAF